MRLHEDINEPTITALSSLPSCQQLALAQVMKVLQPWLYSFTCSWSKVLTALFPILHQVDIIFQCNGFKWGRNDLDKSTETRQQESITAFEVLQKNPGFWKKSEIQHWNCYYTVSLGLALFCSQSPWCVLSIKRVQGEWICLNHCWSDLYFAMDVTLQWRIVNLYFTI